MSLSGIVSSFTTKVESVIGVDHAESGSVGGGGVPFNVGATSAGAYIAQGGGAPGQGGSSLVKKMLVGGVVGAGVGFGATFINPLMAIFTSTTPVGWAIKAAAAGIGAAVGAGGALVMHLISRRRQNLAMQAQAQAAQQGAMAPTPMPAGGATLRTGARGVAARKLQTDLRTIGLYKGKLNGAFDAATSQAVRKYEVMKGVMPTGQGSPDLRAAVAQDAALSKRYA